MIYSMIIALLIASFSGAARAEDFSLVGSWKLISMEQQQLDGQWKARCPLPSGILTYTQQGYMSVGINCQENKSTGVSTEIKDMIFYSGTYTLGDKSVTHHILNSNHADFIGQDLTREWRFENYLLALGGSGMSNNTVRLVWQKIE